jgi:hypothetical protein
VSEKCWFCFPRSPDEVLARAPVACGAHILALRNAGFTRALVSSDGTNDPGIRSAPVSHVGQMEARESK